MPKGSAGTSNVTSSPAGMFSVKITDVVIVKVWATESVFMTVSAQVLFSWILNEVFTVSKTADALNLSAGIVSADCIHSPELIQIVSCAIVEPVVRQNIAVARMLSFIEFIPLFVKCKLQTFKLTFMLFEPLKGI